MKSGQRWLAGVSALALCVMSGPAMAQAITAEGEVIPVESPITNPWNLGTGNLWVGFEGSGTLTIAGGASVSNAAGHVGANQGSTGAVDVTGAGSTWTNSGALIVGDLGTGMLTVREGGAVSNANGTVGYSGTGEVLVTGSGSTWTNNGDLIIGHSGNGKVTIADGGVISGFVGYLGGRDVRDGTGIVAVTGQGSTWTNNDALYVGYYNSGTLTVAAGGTVSSAFGRIADRDFSTGVATVTGAGSSWTNGGELSVGEVGNGALTIADGGAVSNVNGYVGRAESSTGKVEVMGVGSTWTNSNELNVGHLGKSGTLTISAGGAVASRTGTIGLASFSSGAVDVTGDRSTWTNSGDLYVGFGGTAALTIADGGTMSAAGWSYIGYQAGATGTVEVTGDGSTWSHSNALVVGDVGTGMLTIREGGAVSNTASDIGAATSSTGTVEITGAGSTWTNSGILTVGYHGGGVLTIADSGRVSAENVFLSSEGGSRGSIVIGAAAGQTATGAGSLDTPSILFGNGQASLVFNHTDMDYTFGSALVSYGSGSHAIEHLAGMTRLTGDSSGFSGTTAISGGTLLVDNRLGGTVNVEASGTLGGSGTVGTTTVVSGGHIAPGTGSLGTLTVQGNLTLSSGSMLDYELAGAGTAPGSGVSDRIVVRDDLVLNGTLNLSQSSETPEGASGFGYYRLMTYGGSLSGAGLTIGTTTGVPGPALYDIQTGGGHVDLFVAGSLPGDDMLQYWQGGNGTWNGTNTQWLNQDGNVPVAWAGNHAVFKNQPGFDGATITVEGSQSFKGLQFVDEGYRLVGNGQLVVDGSERADGNTEIRVLAETAEIATVITGAGGITKTQAGTLVLSRQNTYQGGTTISGGTVQVSEDANLGAASGGLFFNGGTLATTASFDSNRAITLNLPGWFDVAAGTSLGLDGTISGVGMLNKTGAGTLVLTGDNAYRGTFVEAGTLVGDVGSIRGDIANAGTVVLAQTSDASFAGSISPLNNVAGQMIKRGGGALTLAGFSGLDWTVEAGGLVSAADRFVGNVAIGASGAFAFDQVSDASYTGVLSGAGTFTKAGTGSLQMAGDSSGFAGTTTIAGGLLSISSSDNAALGGSMRVLQGGTLGGNGTVGSGGASMVTIASGGTLSPGNSIGTLTVNGNLTFEAGSRFAVEVDPTGTTSDLVHVTGNATLNGGSVAHIGADGTYKLRSSYTILIADGTLSGAFDGVTSNFAFLMPDLAYDYGAGTLSLNLARNDRDFASAALTRNQVATARGIESIGFSAANPVYDAVALMPDDKGLIRPAFDQLSGEVHASAKTALIEDSHFVRDAITDRIRAAFGDVGSSIAPVMAYGPGGPALAPATTDRFAVWGQAFGSWGRFDGDGNAAGLNTSTGGFLMGADAPLGDCRLGLMAGYSQTSFNVSARSSSGSSDNYHLGLYAGRQWGALGFRSGLAYTWHDIDTSRAIAIPGFSNRLTGGYDAGTFQTFGELGYRIETPAIAFEPFANLAYVSLHSDGFTEKSGAAALTAPGQTTDAAFTTLGLRASTNFSLGMMQATARGMLGWRHAFGDASPLATLAFAGSDLFTVSGVPIAKDAAVLETGLDLNLTAAATLGISYQGQFGNGASQNGFNARFKITF